MEYTLVLNLIVAECILTFESFKVTASAIPYYLVNMEHLELSNPLWKLITSNLLIMGRIILENPTSELD
jgi:hypothetical protein